MTGDGWVWTGFDGFVSGTFSGDTLRFQDIFQGAVGTNVKFASSTNTLYDAFIQEYIDLYPNNLPWEGQAEISLSAFCVQMYDALAMIAQAGSNYLDNNPTQDSVTAANLITELKSNTL